MTLADRFGDLVDVEGPLGNQNHIGAAGNAAVERDPASIASHDLDDNDAVVRFGGGVDAVNGFAYDVAGSIESESVVGSAQVVVDGFRHAHDFDSSFVELLRDRQGVVAADRDERIKFVLCDGGGAALNAVRTLGWVGARGAQNGSAAGQNAAHRLQVERHGLVFDQAPPALHETHKFIVIVEHAFAHYGADDCVQARAIAPAR